jgi:hypothetical protein
MCIPKDTSLIGLLFGFGVVKQVQRRQTQLPPCIVLFFVSNPNEDVLNELVGQAGYVVERVLRSDSCRSAGLQSARGPARGSDGVPVHGYAAPGAPTEGGGHGQWRGVLLKSDQ